MNREKIYTAVTETAGKWNKNVGPWDARGRVIIGTALIILAPLQALGYIPLPLFSSVGGAFAGVVLVTEGLLNRCVLYSLLGINRCPVDISESD